MQMIFALAQTPPLMTRKSLRLSCLTSGDCAVSSKSLLRFDNRGRSGYLSPPVSRPEHVAVVA